MLGYIYKTYPENHLLVDKAVSDDKIGFFGGWGWGVGGGVVGSGRTTEK